MRWPAGVVTLSLLFLPMGAITAKSSVTAPLAQVDAAAIQAEIRAVYVSDKTGEQAAPVARHYAAATERLIAEWNRFRDHDNDDGLADFDWDCGCQDRGGGKPFLGPVRLSSAMNGRVNASFAHKLYPGDKVRKWRLLYVKEKGRWLVETIFWPEGDDLASALKREIREAKRVAKR